MQPLITINPAEIVMAIFSVFAVIISTITFYATFSKKFDGKAYPVSRIFLSWSEEENSVFIPTVITQIEYMNSGAQIGKIDNVMLELTINGENVHAFQAILVTEDIDFVLDEDDIYRNSPNVTQYTSVWINPRSNKQQTVIFQPSGSFTLDKPSTLKIKLSYYSVDNLSWRINRNKTQKILWKLSDICYHFKISQDDLDNWKKHETVMLEAEEIIKSREEYFENRK